MLKNPGPKKRKKDKINIGISLLLIISKIEKNNKLNRLRDKKTILKLVYEKKSTISPCWYSSKVLGENGNANVNVNKR